MVNHFQLVLWNRIVSFNFRTFSLIIAIVTKRIKFAVLLVLFLVGFAYSVDFWNFKPFVGSVFVGSSEEKFFYDYKKTGKINDITSFVILASGVPLEKVDHYKVLIDELVGSIQSELRGKKLSRYDTAKYIFDYLHKNVFKVYRVEASRVSDIFDVGYYNCASSTALYNVLLYRFGFEPKVIILPDHVFSVFYIDSYKVEVETTTKYGFDVVRNPKGIDEFSKLTSFSYVPEGKGKRIEAGDEGLLSVLYADQVLLYKDFKKYEEILKASIKAIMLFPTLDVAYTNLRSSYIGLISKYGDLGDFDTMVRVAKEALVIFPGDSDIEDSIKVGYYNGTLLNIKKGNFTEAFERILYIKNNEPLYYVEIKELVPFLVQQWGMSEIEKGNYEGVFGVINKCLMIDTNKTYYSSVNLSYEASKRLLSEGKYQLAVTFNKKLLEVFPYGKELVNNLGYVYNVYGVSLMNEGKLEDAVSVFEMAIRDLPNDLTLKQNASLVYAKLAVKLFEKKQYSVAVSSINKACELNPSRELNNVRLRIYIDWVKFLSLTEENFVLAKKVCDEALSLYPEDPELLKLHKYIVSKLK